jgi:hypothetical protein
MPKLHFAVTSPLVRRVLGKALRTARVEQVQAPTAVRDNRSAAVSAPARLHSAGSTTRRIAHVTIVCWYGLL